MTIIVVVVHSS